MPKFPGYYMYVTFRCYESAEMLHIKLVRI
jgi:hypothetical protein